MSMETYATDWSAINQPSVGLSTALRLTYAGPDEKRKLLNRIDPRLTTFERDTGKKLKIQEYLMTESTEATTLIQEEVYKRILEGAQPIRCFRDILPVYKANGPTLEVPIGPDSSNVEGSYFIRPVADGAAAPDITSGAEMRTIKIKTYREIPGITQNLIDDAMFEFISNQVYITGQKIENQINQEALNTLLDNAGYEWDTQGSDSGLKAIVQARRKMLVQGYIPTTLVVTPDADCTINLDTTFAIPYGWGSQAIDGRNLPLGLKKYMCGVADKTSSYTWRYTTDGDMGMMLLDPMRCGAIAMRDDISVEGFRDPVRDLRSFNIKARFGVSYLQKYATCRIEL